jgi:hypothetical protein
VTPYGPAVRTLKVVVAVGFGLFVLRSLLDPTNYTLLDWANLAIHEAGHLVFQPFGEVLMLLGGSLLQVALPAAIAAESAWRRKERFGAGMVLLWTAESMANVSVYIADASARSLPLLTDDPDTHDWWQLLGRWDLLEADSTIAGIVHGSAWVVYLAGGLLIAHTLWPGATERATGAPKRRSDDEVLLWLEQTASRRDRQR